MSGGDVGAPEIKVVDDLATSCAQELLAAACSHAGAGIVLSGGSTPQAIYRQLAREPEALEGVTLWFGDERCVPPDDERSNYRMVKEAFLDDLDALDVRYVCNRIQGEGGPGVAALAYQTLLEDASGGTPPPAFDLVLLGIGPDGHTLSVFPGQPAVAERTRLVVDVLEAGHEPFVPRVSMTFAALANAKRVIMLATGSAKAEPVLLAFGPGATARPEVPASMIADAVAPGALTVMLDADAASRLGAST